MPKFLLRFFKLVPISLFTAILCLLCSTPAGAQVIWYAGDDDGLSSTFDVASTEYSAIVYEAFTVPVSSGGWNVTGVFGNYLADDNMTYNLASVTSANWAILSSITPGVSATSPTGDNGTGTATVATSVDLDMNTLYTISVTGLSFTLAPGTYWLGVQPITTGDGYLVSTGGAGSSDDAYETANYGGYNYTSVPGEFSMGITGTQVAPEPSSWALCLLGLGCLGYLARARSRRVPA